MPITQQRLKVFFAVMVFALCKFRKYSQWNKDSHLSHSSGFKNWKSKFGIVFHQDFIVYNCYWIVGIFFLFGSIYENYNVALRSIWNVSVHISHPELSVKLVIFLDVALHPIVNSTFWVTEKVSLYVDLTSHPLVVKFPPDKL